MTRAPIRCLDCNTPCRPPPSAAGRCPSCDRRRQGLRNALRSHYGRDWAVMRRALIAAHPWCDVCKSRLDLTADHIVPVARGGTNDKGNLQVLCRVCNSRKGAR